MLVNQDEKNINLSILKNNLTHELNTIDTLINKNSDNKTYLLTVLEELSNDFLKETHINIEEAHLIPELLSKLNEAIKKSTSSELNLDEMKKNISDIIECINNGTTNIDDPYSSLEIKLNLYNKNKFQYKDNIVRNNLFVEGFISSSDNCISALCEYFSNPKQKVIKEFKIHKQEQINNLLGKNPADAKNQVGTNIAHPTVNDTLLISEKDSSIFLPYDEEDIKVLEATTNEPLEDAIRKNFIIPMDKFKNPTISRFTETFKLVRHRSNGKITQALALGVEMMFLYNLNPAIIVACRHVSELKEYVKYMKENKLHLFKHFKVRFEINPAKVRKGNNLD